MGLSKNESKQQKLSYDYFTTNFKSIVEGHIGKYVVIINCEVYEYFDSFAEAVQTMREERFQEGTYIVQKCVNELSEGIAVLRSRILVVG